MAYGFYPMYIGWSTVRGDQAFQVVFHGFCGGVAPTNPMLCYAYAMLCKSGGALYEGIRLSRLFSTGFPGVRRLQTLSVQFSCSNHGNSRLK